MPEPEMNHDSQPENPKTPCCVVIGGRSFIGKPLVRLLLKSEKWIVRIVDSDPSLNLDLTEKNSILSEAISSGKASYHRVDVRDKSQIFKAIEGSLVVFHLGATGPSFSDFYLQYITVVQGTRNIIRACQQCKVKRLIYNSSADVVIDGINEIHNGEESLSYPGRYLDMISELTAQAEAMVLFANRGNGLLTCALRPSNAFGPGDAKLVPFLQYAAKSGFSKFIIGNGENMWDFTYVENIAHAHICAEEALCSKSDFVAGKAFFITDLDSMKLWEFISLILDGLGFPRPRFKVPTKLVWHLAVLSKWVHEKLGRRNSKSVLSPSVVYQFSSTLTFNCSDAQKLIGYVPIISTEEGVALTIESFSNVAEDSHHLRYPYRNEPSKADKLLGNGKVADLLLWRDEKKTFTYFLCLSVLYYWFILSGRTFVSSAAKLLLTISVVLFSHAHLPTSLSGITIKKLSPSQLEVPHRVDKAIMALPCAWNHGMLTLRLVAHGDSHSFLKVFSCLYLFKLLSSLPFSAVTGAALVFSFTAFFVYLQYEDEIDRLLELALIGLNRLKGLLLRNLPVTAVSLLRNHQVIDQDEVPATVKD